MSNETPAKQSNPLWRRCLPTSAAGKAAVLTAIILWLLLVFVWILRWTNPDLIPASQALTWTQIVMEVLLAVAIPVVLYWGLRRWHQVVEGIYPDIDAAWQAGLTALARQGISIQDKPIFLVLGSQDAAQESSLIGALESMVCVQGIPDATGMRHALQWYADSEAIYLFCSGTSALSALAARRQPLPAGHQRAALPARTLSQESSPQSPAAQSPALAAAKGQLVAAASRVAPRPPASPIPSAIPAPPSPVPRAASDYVMTISADSLARSAQPAPEAPLPQSSAAAGPTTPTPTTPQPATPTKPSTPTSEPIMGTIFAGQAASTAPAPSPAARTDRPGPVGGQAAASPNAARYAPSNTQRTTATQPSQPPATTSAVRSSRRFALPSTLDTTDQLPRLRYVCRLLKRARRPLCGINGIVTLIPFELSREGPLQLSALAQAARGDANVIQEELELRAPVTALLVGLEQDKGFNELVQRLQPELLLRRLGGRFDLRTRPSPAELNVHSDRLCDTFEDWVYRLFGRDDALLQQRGNRRLYGLISRIRHELKPRLRIVLGEAFGCESDAPTDHSAGATAFFFSGCYFASTGAETGQPAFVKGVLRDKLFEEQGQVEWQASALKRYRLVRGLIWLGWLLSAGLAGLLLWQWLA